ncbi:MAG TPA: hypothetical protein VD962_07325 [Rubricoccaceae bacterium]|nr:hypothetical protein [Rubricoccaceae bacterium]
MNILYDHLISVLIGAAVILILATTQMRTSQASVEQVTSYSAKMKALSFGSWIEDDVVRLGQNFGRNRYRFEQPVVDARLNTTNFTFFADSIQTSGDSLRLFTSYRLVPTMTVTRDGQERQLYRIERFVSQARVLGGNVVPGTQTAWRHDGYSVSTLSFFRVEMLRRDGTTTNSVVETDYLTISFGMVPEWDIRAGYIRELFWTTTLKIRPFWAPVQV